MKKTYENKEICSECGGECCDNMPGAAYPSDFDCDKNKIINALKSGKWAIDWWPRGIRKKAGYYLRPAVKGKEGTIKDPSWGGKCTFLTKKGCTLKAIDRPRECRFLEPRPQKRDAYGCKVHSNTGKYNAGVAWLKYNSFLETIEKKLGESQ